MSDAPHYGLRAAKRIICSHDASGKSIFIDDNPDLTFNSAPGSGSVARSYSVEKIPAPLTDDKDLKAYLSSDGKANITSYTNRDLVIPGGANLVVVNFEPNGLSQMHRTVSVDFSIVVEGNIELELDNGDKRELAAGDHIIQRGTMHRWRNMSSTKPARLIAVLVHSESFPVNGVPIVEDHVKGTGAVQKDGSRL